MNFVFLTFFFVTSAIAQSGGPSKKETAEYIYENINDIRSTQNNEDRYRLGSTTVIDKFTNDNCTINQVYTNGSGEIYKYSAPVKNLLITMTTMESGDGRQWWSNAKKMHIDCSGGEKCVSVISNKDGVNRNQDQLLITISQDSSQMESLAKALRHLISLCGGRKKLF